MTRYARIRTQAVPVVTRACSGKETPESRPAHVREPSATLALQGALAGGFGRWSRARDWEEEFRRHWAPIQGWGSRAQVGNCGPICGPKPEFDAVLSSRRASSFPYEVFIYACVSRATRETMPNGLLKVPK